MLRKIRARLTAFLPRLLCCPAPARPELVVASRSRQHASFPSPALLCRSAWRSTTCTPGACCTGT